MPITYVIVLYAIIQLSFVLMCAFDSAKFRLCLLLLFFLIYFTPLLFFIYLLFIFLIYYQWQLVLRENTVFSLNINCHWIKGCDWFAFDAKLSVKKMKQKMHASSGLRFLTFETTFFLGFVFPSLVIIYMMKVCKMFVCLFVCLFSPVYTDVTHSDHGVCMYGGGCICVTQSCEQDIWSSLRATLLNNETWKIGGVRIFRTD